MFESIMKFFNKIKKKEEKIAPHSKEAAKERLHLVLMQDRANVSADFLELMKQEIIEVIKKYIDIDEGAIDVRLTNKENEDGTNGAPALYANIPILNIKNEARKIEKNKEEEKDNQLKETKIQKNENEKEKEEQQNVLENKTQHEQPEEKNLNSETKKEKIEHEGKDENKKIEENKGINKKEEKIDSKSKQKIAEEKNTKEKLNQKK